MSEETKITKGNHYNSLEEAIAGPEEQIHTARGPKRCIKDMAYLCPPPEGNELCDSCERTFKHPRIIITWDPTYVSAEDYADLVKAIGDVVRAHGGIGIKRVHSVTVERIDPPKLYPAKIVITQGMLRTLCPHCDFENHAIELSKLASSIEDLENMPSKMQCKSCKHWFSLVTED